MSETTNLKLKKHDEPLNENTNQFNVKDYLNGNWDKIEDFAEQVNDKVIEIEDSIDLVKQRTEQAVEDINTDIEGIQAEQTTQNANIQKNTTDIADLDINKASKTELQEATIALQAELLATRKDLQAGTLEGEDTGESLYLQDSSDARFRSFEIGGNSKQEKRGESNLYDKNTNTISKAVDVNGEEYSSPGWALTDYISVLATNQSLRYSGLTAVGNKPHSAFYNKDKEFISSFKQAVGENTLEIPQNASYVRFTIEIASGDVNTFNVSYVAMPSLECPSPTSSIGQDVNIFDSSIFEDIEQNGVKIKRNSDGTLTLNGTYEGATSWVYRFNLPTSIVTNAKEQLYLSMQKIKGDCTGQIRFTVWEANSDNRWLSFETNQYADLLKEKTYNRASIIIYTGATFDNLTIGLKISNKKDAIYSPFNHGSANITVCNKNLCDNVFEQGVINVSNGKNGPWNNTKYIRTKNYLKIKPNTQFVMTNPIKNRGRKTRFYDKDKNYLGYTAKKDSLLANNDDATLKRVSTMPDNAYYLRFELDFDDAQIGQDVIDGKYKYQLEECETATNYIEHEEQTFTIPIQAEMLEGDYLDLDSEEEVHTWNKVVLDGVNNKITNKHSTILTETNGFYPLVLEGKDNTHENGNSELAHCNYLKVINEEVASLAVKENCLWWEGKYRTIYLSLPFLSITEANNFLKEKYDAGTPLTIYYKLATPTKLPFTEAQKAVAKQIRETLHTYKNGTHVYSVDEISPIFNVKYTKDLNAVINNLSQQAIEGGN